jgi:hypothetical protein
VLSDDRSQLRPDVMVGRKNLFDEIRVKEHLDDLLDNITDGVFADADALALGDLVFRRAK